MEGVNSEWVSWPIFDRKVNQFSVMRIAFLLAVLWVSGCVASGDAHVVDVGLRGGLPSYERPIRFMADRFTHPDIDVSPEGETLVFTVLGDLYLSDIQGGEARLLHSGHLYIEQPRFSPNGRLIAFLNTDGASTSELWLIDVEGKQVQRVSDEHIGRFDWTQDGKRLHDLEGRVFDVSLLDESIFVQARTEAENQVEKFVLPGESYWRRGLVGIRGEDGSTEFESDSSAFSYHPKFSRNRSKLFFASRDERGESSISEYDLATGAERVVRRNHSFSLPKLLYPGKHLPVEAFGVGPSGGFIVFSSGGRLIRRDLQTGKEEMIPVRVTVKGNNYFSRPEPPGFADRVPIRNLSSISVSGSNEVVFGAAGKAWIGDASEEPFSPTRLSQLDDLQFMPSFSPDGKKIVFAGWSDTRFGTLVVHDRKSDTDTVLRAGGLYLNPVWSPDGKRIAFLEGSAKHLNRTSAYVDTDSFEAMKLVVLDTETGLGKIVAEYRPSVSIGRFHTKPQFLEGGNRLWFMEKDAAERSFLGGRQLVSVDIAEGTKLVHARFALEVSHAVPSPDGSSVAIVKRNSVEVYALEPGEPLNLHSHSEKPSFVLRASPEFGVAVEVEWRDETSLTVFSAHRIGIWQLGTSGVSGAVNLGFSADSTRHESAIAFTNVRLVTMNGSEVIERGTLVIEGNRIVSVGGQEVVPPRNAVIMDLEGQTVVPGFVDSHDHSYQLPFGATEIFPQRKYQSVAQLAYGVTTVFDPAARNPDVFAHAEAINAGYIVGPRLFSTGEPIESASSFGGVELSEYRDAEAIVFDLIERGAIAVKSYAISNSTHRRWIVDAAHSKGAWVAAESGDSYEHIVQMAREGHGSIEHYPFHEDGVYGDVAQLLVQTEATLSPTVGTHSVLVQLCLSKDIASLDFEKYRRLFPSNRRRFTSNDYESAEYAPDCRGLVPALKRFHDAGVNITASSHGVAGLGLHLSLWLLADVADLAPLDALRTVTISGAKKLAIQDDVGTLEVGKLADLIILSENPLDDIRNTVAIEYVMKDGRLYRGRTLDQLYPEREVAGRPYWLDDFE